MRIASKAVASVWNSASCPSVTSTRATDRRRVSELLNDVLHQRAELAADSTRGLHHLGMIERLRQHACRHVRDARNAQDLHAHVARDDGFGHRGHADRVGADRSQISDLRGRFVTGTQQSHIDAVREAQPNRPSRLVGNSTQPRRIHFGHIGESRAKPIIVRTDERVGPHQVDVIVDDHQRALREAGIHASGRVGENHRPDAEQAERADGERHRRPAMAFVHVAAAGQRRNRAAAHRSDDELAVVTDDARDGPVRKVPVRHRHRVGERSGEIAEARTEHDSDLRNVADLRSNGVCSFFDLVVIIHREAEPGTSNRVVGYKRNPAIVAVMKFASVPANMARRPSRARSCRRFGASAPMPPIWMPSEPKFAKPHSANVQIVNDFGSSCALSGPSCEYATNSLSAIRVPSRLPIVGASRHGTPIDQATGANTHPKICCRLRFARPSSALTSAMSARNEMSIAPTFRARCSPSPVPRPAASITLTSVFSTSSFTFPIVFGTSVSGTSIFAIMIVPGAVMITAVSRCLASMPKRMYAAMMPPEMCAIPDVITVISSE